MSHLRSEVVKLVTSWVGKKESDGSHKEIIDIYNSYSGPLPRGTKMLYSWAWCACTWSALAIKLGYTDIMPIEISCPQIIARAKEMGCWQENDGYIAQPGDAVLYDWGDTGVGDNTGSADHIGTIVATDEKSGYFTVVEGNYDDSVKKRTLSINGKFIRGFITPKYDIELLELPERESGKSLSDVAHEVIAGVWGNGSARTQALKAAGYDSVKVQLMVNEILNGTAKREPSNPTPTQNTNALTRIEATCAAKYYDSNVAGKYRTVADLYCRNDAGTNKKALCLIPNGTEVRCYGYYSLANNSKWLYIKVSIGNTTYVGFSSASYLKRA